MRYFIYYPPTKSTRLIDVGDNMYVEEILRLVEKEFGLQVHSHGLTETSVILNYNGFDLKPKWSIGDLNIPSGSIIRCIYKEKKAADLYIHCEFNKQILKLFDAAIKFDSPIALIRKKISDKLGIPLSIFCLETYHRRVRLYDQMNLTNYDIKIHDHLVLKVWKGYEKFISSCIRGYAEHYSHDDLTRYYQMQIALYIAAYYGHMELASSVLQHGARSDRPVGEHPSRQWSSEAITSTIPEALKCPIHIAIERGHVKIVDLFVRQSIVCTQVRDPTTGYLPYRLALHCLTSAKTKQEKQCMGEIYFFLHDKQYNLRIPLNATGDYVISLLTATTGMNAIHHPSAHHGNISLPFYCRIMSWYERARESAWKKFGGHFCTLTQGKRVYPRRGLLGYKVLIDGYNNTFEVPHERLRSLHSSGGTSQSDKSDVSVGYSEEDRGKIIQMKTFMKQFTLDDHQRAKQIAATNLQHSRRPPLFFPRVPANGTKHSTTSQVLEGTISPSQFSISHVAPSLPSQNLKLFQSNFDSDMDKLSHAELIRRETQSLQEKPKRKPKFFQTASTITCISDDNRYTASNVNPPISSVLPQKFESFSDIDKQSYQSIMSSSEAFLISSSSIALEIEERNATRKRELLAQIEQTLQQQQPPPRVQEPSAALSMTYSTNLFTEFIPIERQSAIDAETHVSLPDHPTSFRNGPIKTHFDDAIRQTTFETYQRYASANLRTTAVNCLEEASFFKRKSWIKQVEIGKAMVKNRVHQRMRRADNKLPAKSSSQPIRATHETPPYKRNTLKAN